MADMAIQRCNFDNFDIGQMSPKFAQRQYFVYNFCYKKISIVGSLDNAENCLKTLFLWTPVMPVEGLENEDRKYKHDFR